MRKYRGTFQNGIYRSREGMILGVCKGLAEYFDFSIFWTRAIAIIFLLISGLWPIMGIYFVAALIMKPKPVRPITSSDEQEFYDTYSRSRESAGIRIKKKYQNLENRLPQKIPSHRLAKVFRVFDRTTSRQHRRSRHPRQRC